MIGTILDRFCNVLRVLLGVLIAALSIPVGMQVISRYVGILPNWLWTEELATFIFVWVVMVGSMVAVWDSAHFDVQVIPTAKSPLLRLLQNTFVLVMIIIFAVLFAYYGIEYAEFGGRQNSVMMRANLMITHIAVPVAGVVWAIFGLYRLYETFAEYFGARRASR